MAFRAAQAKGPSVAPINGGGGGGSVTSSFTAGNIPVASSTTNLTNSVMSQVAGNIILAGGLTIATTLGVTGVATFTDLAGSGTRMVVASSTGVLSTQAIPAGGTLANPTGTIGLTAVNGVLTTGLRSDGAPALSQAIVPTWSGIHTFTLKPIFSSLTASLPVFSDASKGLVSNTMTGTGNVVMSASPTLTGTVIAAAATLSGVVALNMSGSGASSALIMSAAVPTISWQVTGAGSNEKVWDLTFTATTMDFRTRTDALGAGNTFMQATRSGTTVTLFTLATAVTVGVAGSSAQNLLVNGYMEVLNTGGNSAEIELNTTGGTGSPSLWRVLSLGSVQGALGAVGTLAFRNHTTSVTALLLSSAGGVTAPVLAGSGTRMVVADATGVLSTQTIPTGSTLADPTGTIGLTAVNGVLTSGMRSDGAPALSQAIVPTWSGIHTFTLKPIFSSATASTAAAFDGSKGLVSVTNTGTGNNVLSASPTFTGTVVAAAMSLSGNLTVATIDATAGLSIISGNVTVLNGTLTVGANASDKALILNGQATSSRALTWHTAGSLRWRLRMDSDAESGSNAGADMTLFRYADDGTTPLGVAYTVTRATGAIAFAGILTHLATISTDVTLTISSNLVAVNAALADNFKLVLNANATISNPSNPAAGRMIRFRIQQAGSFFTLAWGSAFEFMNATNTPPSMTGTLNKYGYFAFKWNEVTSTWQFVGSAIYADA
jgi:hypothetical protein